MPKKIEMVGKVFGEFTVIEEVEHGKKGQARFLCLCSCGKTKIVDGYYLRTGRIKSCGHYAKEKNTKHGGRNERLYQVWKAMKRRCNNPNSDNYHNYGARGIKVDGRWEHDYAAFREFMISHGYDESAPSGTYTIDRIDVNGNYCPENCRVISLKEQAFNKTNNHKVIYNGKEMTVTEAAKLAGIHRDLVFSRLTKGWDEERALSEPCRTIKTYTANDETYTISEWAEILETTGATIRGRLKKNQSMQEIYNDLHRT